MFDSKSSWEAKGAYVTHDLGEYSLWCMGVSTSLSYSAPDAQCYVVHIHLDTDDYGASMSSLSFDEKKDSDSDDERPGK